MRKRQRSSMNVTEDDEKHSVTWRMFMFVTMESVVFMGKFFWAIVNRSSKWLENHSWKYLFLFGNERIINLQCSKVYVFSDSVLCLGKIQENPQWNDAWEQRLGWFKTTPEYRTFDRIDGWTNGIQMAYFPGFKTLQLSSEVKHLLLRLGETPEFHKKDYLHVDAQRHLLWIKRQ